MNVEQGWGKEVIVRYRDKNGERKTVKHGKKMKPFCYVRTEDLDSIRRSSLSKLVIGSESGHEGIYGEELTKVSFGERESLKKMKESKYDTWEANISWVNRVMHTLPPFPMYEHRVWCFDMEWKTDSGEITIITIKDSETDNVYVLFQHEDYEVGYYDKIKCKNHPEQLEEVCFAPAARAFACERDLLHFLAGFIRKQDPDIITGWNVVNADMAQLFKRMKVCGLDPRVLSPHGNVRYNFRDWGQPISGINIIDMMIGFKQLWTLKNGQLPAMSLDAVSEFCLGERKVSLEDGHDTYYTDFGTYLDYARKDVLLPMMLNEMIDVLGYYTAIQHIVQCDIRTTPHITNLFTVLALGDKDFEYRLPTKPQFEKVDYEGADIFIPEAGVYDNIGILDVKAMYHSNIKLHNISWDNLCATGVDCGNGVRFKQEEGLLGRQMDKMTTLRNEYKAKMKKATTETERRKYDTLQYATKSLIASMYGVAGDSKYSLYHPDIAAAITHTSRQTLRKLKECAEELGCKVQYGHTDSIMCEMESAEAGIEINKQLNEMMKPIIVEYEKFCSSFLILAKNRYAGKTIWTEGAYHEEKIFVKGIEMKQSRLPNAMKQALSLIVDGLLDGKGEAQITNSLVRMINKVVKGNLPPTELCIRAKLKQDLSKYAVLGEARAGAKWANDTLGKGYRGGDYFLCTLNERGDYIAFDEPSEIEGIENIGYWELANRFIIAKVRPYYELMGWDDTPLDNALRGIGEMEWF